MSWTVHVWTCYLFVQESVSPFISSIPSMWYEQSFLLTHVFTASMYILYTSISPLHCSATHLHTYIPVVKVAFALWQLLDVLWQLIVWTVLGTSPVWLCGWPTVMLIAWSFNVQLYTSSAVPLIAIVTLVDCRDDTWIGVTPDYYIGGAEIRSKNIFMYWA